MSHFVVLDRPGYDKGGVEEMLRREVHRNFQRLADGSGFQHPSGFRVIFQETTLLDISATQIRGLVREGKSIRFLLPEAVRRFILKNRLYS